MPSVKQVLTNRIQTELKDNGVYRKLPVLEGSNDARVVVKGRSMVNIASNIYLGLANNKRIKKAAIKAIKKYGVGAGAVRTIAGNMDLHEQLDKVIAEFKQEPAALAFQSGLNCNMAVIPAIMQEGDLMISDQLNHASIIDGMKLTKAEKVIYKHTDMKDLEEILSTKRKNYKNCMIITDGVFSMDGDLAPLPEIVKLAKKYDAWTYVDDAHGSGTMGANGRGTVDHFHLHGQIDFIVGTLSKAVGVVGGYVCCNEESRDWLLHRARALLFSTAQPPMVIAACIEAIKIMNESDELTKKLWDNANYFKQQLSTLGFNVVKSESPITPVIIGEEAKSMEFAKQLREEGIYAVAIIFPTVPKGTGRIRCMLSAAHEKKDLDLVISAFSKVGKQMGIVK